MSSTIKLYEHNQKAYDALLDMLGERDRACVIKPTGTGKFVILAKMVQDNPDKRFLLLGTNDYMFNDQMANLAEIAPGFTPENLQFMTYTAAMMAARRGEEISGYDVVVADEFHHCGAEEWGKGVTHIIDANGSAKVVGFSATPIRYSDGGRNMADEMFDGNVAYSMELEEAWLRGVLPIPKYIVALYEAPSELGKLARTIKVIKDEVARERFRKKYEKLRRALVEAGGVREVMGTYLKKENAKVVVFCPNAEKLHEFMLLKREWFGTVNKNPATEGTLCKGGRGYRLQRRIRPRIPFRRRGAPERGFNHYGYHVPVQAAHGKALQADRCRRPHRLRVDGQGARVACRRARNTCRTGVA